MSASVRVLVFGGSGFIEHLRIGDWPAFPSGMLSDSYGLGAGSLSVGIGVRDDKPFVTYRESQQQRDRTYPYWLLLDPGETLWQRFDWNGAAILAALTKTVLWQQLRQEPERIDQAEARRLLNALDCEPLKQSPSGSNALGAFIVGAAAHEAAISTCSPPLVTDRRLESVEDLAAVLADLQPAFRVGQGWLLNGAVAHAKELGCAAVVDPRSSPDAGAQVIRTGRALLECVRVVEESVHSGALRGLLAEPLFRWPLDTLRLVSAFGNLLSDSEESIDWVGIDFARVPPHLAYEFVHASLSAPRRTGTFSSGRTQFLVARAIAGDLPPRVDLAAWDLSTVAIALADNSVPFDRFISKLGLSPDSALELWRHFCSYVPEHRILTALNAVAPVVGEPALDHFADVALQRIQSSTSLQEWCKLSLPATVSNKVFAALREQAIARMVARRTGWEMDVVLYAADALAAGSRASLEGADITALVRAALDMTGNSVRQRATEFLSALARSPFRASVSIGLKRAVAARAPAAWADFCVLLDLWDGRPSVENKGRELNRTALFSELRDLVREYHGDGEPPNLSGLVGLWGSDWPSELSAEIRRCRPSPRTILQARSWLDGWKTIDPQWAHSEEARIRKAILSQMLDDPDGVSVDDLRRLSKTEIAESVGEYLCTVSAPEDVLRRANNVLRLAERHSQAKTALDLFLTTGHTPSARTPFVEVMLNDQGLLATAASIVAPRAFDELLAAMVKTDQNAFSEIVIDSLGRSAREPAVRRMAARLATYVRSSQPSVARRVTRSMFGGDAAEFRATVDKLKKGRI
ncbi:MAG: hypothetical protein FJ398_18975 [Verrucomicrobia bacterium]|nr:hypothetical protein [Verrucomicrobiota bacterium]